MRYPGGKGNCFRHLVNVMPPHHTYIETHLGGGNVLERKRPAARNIGIDIDPNVIAKWGDAGSRFPLELHNGDAVAFLKSFPFDGGELVYADPPYLHATRRDPSLYRFEYTDAQHVELLTVLRSLPCAVMVSGYWSSLYVSMLQGWRCVRFPNKTRRGRVIECAWFNFPMPDRLHDPRYVGSTFRERERIKRKRNRWRARLAAMTPGERQVILEALREVESEKSGFSVGERETDRVRGALLHDLSPPRYLDIPLFGELASTIAGRDDGDRIARGGDSCRPGSPLPAIGDRA